MAVEGSSHTSELSASQDENISACLAELSPEGGQEPTWPEQVATAAALLLVLMC